MAARHFYIDGATPVPVSTPTSTEAFDLAAKRWVDTRPLSELRANKWADVKLLRDAAEMGVFTYNGMVFDGDVPAQRRLSGYISVSKSALASGTPFEAQFTLANDSLVTLTAADFVGIEMAKIQAVAEAFARAAALRAQIDDPATTADELALISF